MHSTEGSSYDSPFRHFSRSLVICVALFTPISVSLANAQTETVIHSFRSNSNADGSEPFGGVVADSSGALYGTTEGGGNYRQGAIYKLSPPKTLGGLWKQNILYSFQGDVNGTRDGADPVGNIVLTKGGKIYGTTYSGGQYDDGAVFELSPPTQAGTSWTETIIYSFLDSAALYYGLTAGTGGRLYGTTDGGGRYNEGFVFALSPPKQSGNPWTETVLYNFDGSDGISGGGASSVILDASGNVYGTTFYGGVVYQLVPSGGKGAWTENILYSFSGAPGDGLSPTGLVFGSAGALYGATLEGGQFGAGTVYQLSPPTTQGGAWTEQVLYSFGGFSGDSINPITSLVLDSAGALYGASENGRIHAARDSIITAAPCSR